VPAVVSADSLDYDERELDDDDEPDVVRQSARADRRFASGVGVVRGGRPRPVPGGMVGRRECPGRADSPRREDISALAALDAQHAWIMFAGIVAVGLSLVGLGPRHRRRA
jgi:hypothetical protein